MTISKEEAASDLYQSLHEFVGVLAEVSPPERGSAVYQAAVDFANGVQGVANVLFGDPPDFARRAPLPPPIPSFPTNSATKESHE